MLDLVPLFVRFYIFNTEIGAQVDDLYFRKNFIIYQGSTESLWSCCKNDVYFLCKLLHVVVLADIVY